MDFLVRREEKKKRINSDRNVVGSTKGSTGLDPQGRCSVRWHLSTLKSAIIGAGPSPFYVAPRLLPIFLQSDALSSQ